VYEGLALDLGHFSPMLRVAPSRENRLRMEKLKTGKHDKLIFQILRGTSDANISFSDLIALLQHFGFEMRHGGP